jgi:hypothetical protein
VSAALELIALGGDAAQLLEPRGEPVARPLELGET